MATTLGAPYAAIRDQAHVRLLAGDMLDDEIIASITAMRPQLEAIEALLAASEQRALDLPHRTHYLLLAQSLGRHLVAAYRVWIDEVERELSNVDPPHQQRTDRTLRGEGHAWTPGTLALLAAVADRPGHSARRPPSAR